MRSKILKTMVFVGLVLASATAIAASLLDVSYRPLAGKAAVNLKDRYAGQVLLIVNTASKCGYTPQYEGLEALHQRYAAQGLPYSASLPMTSRDRSRAARRRSRSSAR